MNHVYSHEAIELSKEERRKDKGKKGQPWSRTTAARSGSEEPPARLTGLHAGMHRNVLIANVTGFSLFCIYVIT